MKTLRYIQKNTARRAKTRCAPPPSETRRHGAKMLLGWNQYVFVDTPRDKSGRPHKERGQRGRTERSGWMGWRGGCAQACVRTQVRTYVRTYVQCFSVYETRIKQNAYCTSTYMHAYVRKLRRDDSGDVGRARAGRREGGRMEGR